MGQPRYSYARVAWCYDAVASLYSLRAIDRAKAWHARHLQPGDRVLYVGAGTGGEIALACRAGASVVCVEPCPAMAHRLRKHLMPWRDRVTVDESPLTVAAGQGDFDFVVGHFFFNVFGRRDMPGVLAVALSHVKPGGQLIIADFAPGRSAMSKALRALYYRPVNLAGCALGMCALHPIYDYAHALDALDALGLVVQERRGFPVLPGTPGLYETLRAQKRSTKAKHPPVMTGGC